MGFLFCFFDSYAFCSFEVCVAQTCCQIAGVDGKLDNSWLTHGCGVCTGGQCKKKSEGVSVSATVFLLLGCRFVRSPAGQQSIKKILKEYIVSGPVYSLIFGPQPEQSSYMFNF